MSDKLLPCPFCGAGETLIREHDFWVGTRSETISFEIIHWCPKNPLQSSMSFKAKTKEDVVKIWNTRKGQENDE